MTMLRAVALSIGAVAIIGCGAQITSTAETVMTTPTPRPATSSPTASPSPSQSPSPSPTLRTSPSAKAGLTREEAIAAVMQIPEVAERKPWLLSARVEHWGDDYRYPETSPAPEPSRLVWVVDVAYESPSPTGGAGWFVILDYQTGEILSFSQWMG
jgi:hypothetical protein